MRCIDQDMSSPRTLAVWIPHGFCDHTAGAHVFHQLDLKLGAGRHIVGLT